MKYIAKKRQYGSIIWYEFNSIEEMFKVDIIAELAGQYGYYGIIDIYTDDKELLSEKQVEKDWYTDEDDNLKDMVYYHASEELCIKYNLGQGGDQIFPLSELPTERVESPRNPEILKYVNTND